MQENLSNSVFLGSELLRLGEMEGLRYGFHLSLKYAGSYIYLHCNFLDFEHKKEFGSTKKFSSFLVDDVNDIRDRSCSTRNGSMH